MARILAKHLKAELGQPIVVTNRTGGGGVVAATYLKTQAADGYNVVIIGADCPAWFPLTQDVNFTYKSFDYLAAVAMYGNALTTLADKPYKNLKELIAYSKKHPGLSVGYLSTVDLAIFQDIAAKEGLDWKYVPTKGGSELMALLLGNKIDVAYSGGSHNKYPGKVIVLASLNKKRLLEAPDKETVVELGYAFPQPSYVITMVPAGTPKDVKETLSKAILKASEHKDFVTIAEKRLKSPVLSVGMEELEEHMFFLNKALEKAAKMMK